MPLYILVTVVGTLSLAAAIIFASIFGRKAERWGAGIVGGGMLLTWTAQALAGAAPLAAFLAIDLTIAVGLGVLTFRYPDKLWPGLAGCAQFLVFVFSVTRAINFPLSETAYLIMLNVSALGVAASLAGGTWGSRWYKRRPSEWDLSPA